MPTTARRAIREFILPRFPAMELDDRCDLFSLGLVNSLFAMEIVMFIEKLTGHQIPREELILDHFRSVDAMTRLTERLAEYAPEQKPAGVV
jgi:acyl carrier protein